ncbi:MAG TPA: hypothetical protein VFQ34_08855 [Nitrospiraceae bacterium]|jgi:hypothetical protein|nr:hypothetical protein [Nitrospiraceae bacterium]
MTVHRTLLGLCVTLGLSMLCSGIALATTDLPLYGGLGGQPFKAECPKGFYLVGLAGKAGSWVDRIAPVCAPWLRSSQAFGTPTIGQSFGMSGGGQEQQAVCTRSGNNHLAIQSWWIHPLRSDNHYVQYIQMYCDSLPTPLPPTNYGPRLDFGTRPNDVEELITFGPFSSQPPFQACPAGEAAVGIRVRAGQFVDAIGLICGPLPLGPTAPAPKVPGPLVQAPPLAKPLSPQTKNMMIPDDMFVITRPVAGDRLSQGQLVIAATKPKVGWTNVTELELKYLDAPPNQADAYPYTTVFSVDTTTLLQGYSVAPIVTGYNGRWQVRARSSMKAVPGPWSFPVQFNMVNAQTQSPMLQAPKPNAPITQTPAPRTGMAPLMIRPRGTDEKAGKESKAAGDSPENEKKP